MPHTGGIYWDDHGGRGPAIILSSGLGGSGGYWGPNIPGLTRECRVITYDHRGTGRSEREIPGVVSVEAAADDILTVMDAAGLPQATVVGHAAGGLFGLALALKVPERLASLVVINGWAKLDPHTARCFDTRLALLRDSGPRPYLHAQPLFLYPPEWISKHHDQLVEEEEALLDHFPGAEMMQRRIAAVRLFNIRKRLAEVTVPTLCIASEDDMLVPPHCSSELAEGIAHGALSVMRGGHACNVTRPDEFNERLVSWLYGRE